MLRRRTLIHLSITLTLAVIACGLFYWKFVRPFLLLTERETPKELRDPGVRVGAGLLSRTEFVKTHPADFLGRFIQTIGSAEDVAVGEFDGQAGTDVVVAGGMGARVYDTAGKLRSETRYQFAQKEVKLGPFSGSAPKTMLGEMRVIDLEGDGSCEYYARGSLDGAALFDHGGHALWTYGEYTDDRTSIDDMAAGDLDGDGVQEFVAGRDAVELFDRYGRQLWGLPWKGTIHALEVADADGDGEREILLGHGKLLVLDARGKTLRDVELPFYLGRFSACARPDGRTQLLAVEDGYVWTFDSKGESVGRLAAPLAELKGTPRQTPFGEFSDFSAYQGEGVWVKLDAARPERLAVITQYVAADRSVLYVYEASGELVYEEVLPEGCGSIAALPAEGGRPQEFLVGCENTVWRYRSP